MTIRSSMSRPYGVVTFLLALCAVVLWCGCSPTTKKSRHLARGEEYFKAEQYDKAEVEFLNVLRLERTNAAALRQLGMSYYYQGRLSHAYAFLQKATELNPGHDESRVRFAGLLVAARKLPEARVHAEAVLARDPGNEEALMLLADTVTSAADFAPLQQRVESARSVAENKAGFHLALGTLQLRQQRTNEALAHFQRALAVDAQSSPTHLALGNVFALLKDNAKAEIHFQKAAQLAPARSARRLQYADFKLRSGDLVAAKTFLETLAKEAPDYLPTFTRLAEIALAERQFDQAVSLSRKILGRDPGNYEAMLLLGRVSLARGEPAAALADFERIVSAHPRAPQAHHHLAMAHLMNKNQLKAITSLQQAIALDPRHTESILLLAELNIRKNDVGPAIAALQQVTQQQPQIIRAHLLLAEAYRTQRDFGAAAGVYERMSRTFPNNPQPYFVWGQLLLQQGKKGEAREKFERAMQVSPDFLFALEELVTLDIDDQQLSAAEKRVKDHIAKNSKAPALRLFLARIYLARKDYERAEEVLSEAIALDPGYQPAYLALARVYVDSKRHQPALDKLEAVLAKTPTDIAALMMMGMLQNELKNYSAAAVAYEKLIAANPRFSPALNNLAYIYSERLNNPDKAYGIARTARELRPFDPHVADTLAWIVYKRGEYPWALGLLQESAERLPRDGEVLFHLAMTHYMLGEEQPAAAAFQRALETGMDFPGKAEAQKRLALLPGSGGESKTLPELERLLQSNPRDPVLLSRIGLLHEQAGAFDAAAKSYAQALEGSPRNVSVMTKLAQLYAGPLRNPSRALQIARDARALAPEDPVIGHGLGRVAFQAGDYQWSLSVLRESARSFGNHAELLYDLAWAAYSMGHLVEADAAMRKALQANPSFRNAADAQRFLDMTAVALKPETAHTVAPKIAAALQHDSAHAPALFASGILQEDSGNLNAARDSHRGVLSRFPSFFPAQKRLAILLASSVNDRRAAYEHALKAREALPDDPEVARVLGMLSFHRQEYPRAAQLLRESSRKRTNDAEAFYYLGMAEYHCRQKRDAIEALKYALVQDPAGAFAPQAKRILAELQ